MTEIEQLAIDCGSERLAGLVDGFRSLMAELRFEAGETAIPSLAAADNGGIDQQFLPSPRGSRSGIGDRNWIGLGRLITLSGIRLG